ncbi:MAG TPA: hypothetical protein VK251_10275, partial [Steroidobacteraceae bacterium]|nr:hypothetical protein [Steroidobacteraceae bacterium]
TCDDCAMCAHAGDAHGPSRQFFSATVKCCSYVPELANFLVGRILSDTDAAAQAGRSTVNDRIAAGLGVTPLGLQQSAVYSQLYRGSDAAFGRSQALRCPHFLEDGGRCGIWRHGSRRARRGFASTSAAGLAIRSGGTPFITY